MVAGRLLTAPDVRDLLARHGLAPRKGRGQNFVVDPNTVRKVVRAGGVRPGELVCEIGPGLGSLTLGLREAGARVVAVEVDAGFVRALREVAGDDPGVRVVHADALAVDFAALLEGEPAALVANLPYRTATAMVLRCLHAAAFTRLHVMVQREVGQRWVAVPGGPAYGAVSVKVAALAWARLAGRVSRQAFYPVPGVDSVTVNLRPRRWDRPVDRAAVLALAEEGFGQRRKQLRNALSGPGGDRSPGAVQAGLAAAGLPASARAEELGLDAWVALARALA